ncbi:MAG: HAMP domain-containing protein [Myxococcales bacterium]|nr:HAMP domain-containing protein [Myxococcales bacterium]
MSQSEANLSPQRAPRRVGLQVKLVTALLLLSLLPLAVSALLVGNIGEVAQNFAGHHAAALRPPLERAQGAYREVISTKKSEFQEVARRLTESRMLSLRLAQPAGLEHEADWDEVARNLLREHSQLILVSLVRGEMGVLGSASRKSQLPPERVRELELKNAVGDTGAQLNLVFAADMQPVLDLQDLGEALAASRRVDSMKSSLPSSYRIAFLLLVGGVVIVVTLLALLFARRIGRRIAALVAGTREVAKGDLGARVNMAGKDELAELATAFNTMVGDLDEERQKTLYLQRIGAWQDVARKLAHEIKNPLTPIQLVVQQAVSSYDGDDEQYKRLLASCDEIVREEVQGLRRLVDAFRDLGRLPKVEASPLAVDDIISDLRANAELEPSLEVEKSASPMTVRADRLLLRRALVNLLENGVQASVGGRGKVVLRCEVVGEMARFTIEDAGPGVPIAKRDVIFDPYVTSKETGTGLGLAIAKKVALDHHGVLYLDENASSLGGARFVLEIPLA